MPDAAVPEDLARMDAFVRRVAISQLKSYRDARTRPCMDNFDELESLVAQGSVRVIHIDAVARSMSTVLGRALAEGEGESLYVNEPHNKFTHDIDSAARVLLDAFEARGNKEGPVTIVTKSIARNLSTEEFVLWTQMCDGVVFSVRDPMTQIWSLLTRITNDRFVHRGADELTSEQVAASAQWIVREEEWEAWQFESPGWPALERHYQASGNLKHLSVVDGEELLADPEAVLMAVCEQLGLPYSPAMIHGWRQPLNNAPSLDKGYGHKFDASGVPTNAWVRHAAASRGFESPRGTGFQFDINCLPASLQLHLTEVAMPIYAKLLDGQAHLEAGTSPNGHVALARMMS